MAGLDTQRLILLLIFFFSGFYLWQAWERDHAPPPAPAPATAPAQPGIPPASVPSATPSASSPAAVPAAGAPPTAAAPAGQIVSIRTDLYTADVDTTGGVITQVALAKHRDAFDQSKPYLALMRTADRTFVAQSGLIGEGMPNHRTAFEVLPGPRELAPGADSVQLKLQATAANGDKVVKVLTFHRGSYVIDTAFEITNTGSAPISPEAYFQLMRDTKQAVPTHSMAPASFVGPVVYDDKDKFKKVEFKEIDKEAEDPSRKAPYTRQADNGWIGMIEHYFVVAWLPPQDKPVPRQFYTNKLDNGLYTAGVRYDGVTIPPGQTGEISGKLYVGPQDQATLGKLAPGLDLVVDYGIFTIIAAPLFLLLKWLHSLLGNWGWAIVVMTILIKSAFYPLNHASARSMAKMKLVAPKMKALQEQYAGDKQQLQMKMMELYRQEKINPLGGCLPILVQIPVFIALYWVLLSAVELRHAPWIGWIHDLSAPDPWYVLPVIYAVTAYLQVKLSPTPVTDPVQAKVMQFMPIAFSVMFLFFPAGLVLYWLINNCIQIFQQWHMNRVITREQAALAAKRR
ncbi:MAG TPA: membrane protein insertase YidC [Casimicrobiaceae bacterium]|jgi:YidC/Oxa1 family membrane protein insertase|nr:membrane protein insertase YidC [Casimicrobiaceae bacterium]